MSTILFSPIGGTDPIPQTNFHDGSMLHITRVYKPDKIILYMSKEMLAFHRLDNRYLYCLEQLFKLQGRENVIIDIIERPDLEDAQNYDYFYRDFDNILSSIQNEMAPGDQLLVNITSGTPAMKSALYVLMTLLNLPFIAIQVTTPNKSMNEHHHEGYNVEACWDLNQDNRPDFVDRTTVFKCPTLKNLQTQNIIHRHILAYDYQAALFIANPLPLDQTKSYLPYLQMAAARYTLSHDKVRKLSSLTGYVCYPFKTEKNRTLFEYLLVVQVRYLRKEFADFVRSLTPAIMHLFLRIMEKHANLDPDIYTYRSNEKLYWNKRALEKDGLLGLISSVSESTASFVQSKEILVIIDKKVLDTNVVQLCKSLRDVETAIRNSVAHDIVEVTAETIQEKTGHTPAEIMALLKRACTCAGISATSKEWSSYDQMNDVIISHMDI